MKPEYILEVKHLNVFYKEESRSILRKPAKKQVLFDISFDVKEGEILGIVGESGCGKSSLSKALLGMNPMYEGKIVHYSDKPQMIFQDPFSSLNPVRSIGWILEEPLRLKGIKDKAKRKRAVEDMLCKVGLDASYAGRRPAALSGGQRQRVSIAAALIGGPRLVVADEPLSALDVTIQAQIMKLMIKLQREMGLTYLFISHDIDVVYQMCSRILVMREGRIVEIGETKEMFENPQEEYTRRLIEG